MQVRSVTREARRAQILAATTEVLAEVGYRQTSFAKIVQHAGLSSTRLISYHFAGKDELIAAVAADVMDSISAHMTAHMDGAGDSAAALLRAYIEGVVEYVADHRAAMKALVEILLNGALNYGPSEERAAVGPVERILRAGQASGEFRDFDPLVMGTVIQRAVDGLSLLLEGHPDLDTRAYAAELTTLFELATRA